MEVLGSIPGYKPSSSALLSDAANMQALKDKCDIFWRRHECTPETVFYTKKGVFGGFYRFKGFFSPTAEEKRAHEAMDAVARDNARQYGTTSVLIADTLDVYYCPDQPVRPFAFRHETSDRKEEFTQSFTTVERAMKGRDDWFDAYEAKTGNWPAGLERKWNYPDRIRLRRAEAQREADAAQTKAKQDRTNQKTAATKHARRAVLHSEGRLSIEAVHERAVAHNKVNVARPAANRETDVHRYGRLERFGGLVSKQAWSSLLNKLRELIRKDGVRASDVLGTLSDEGRVYGADCTVAPRPRLVLTAPAPQPSPPTSTLARCRLSRLTASWRPTPRTVHRACHRRATRAAPCHLASTASGKCCWTSATRRCCTRCRTTSGWCTLRRRP
jgi:hypothetical protein